MRPSDTYNADVKLADKCNADVKSAGRFSAGEKRIAVVMPAYNCSEYIRRAIITLPTWLDELIVVDDASTDNTVSIIERCLSELKNEFKSEFKSEFKGGIRCTLIKHRENRGVGAAICSGYTSALESRADVICVMAGDAQMDPDDLHAIVDPIVRDRADYVKGNRYASNQHIPRKRQLGTAVLTTLTRFSSGYTHINDSQCGYTAISREMLAKLDLSRIFERYGYPNDMLAKLHVHDARVVEVPICAVYDQQSTGISWKTVVHPIGTRLIYSWANRVYHERQRRIANTTDISTE